MALTKLVLNLVHFTISVYNLLLYLYKQLRNFVFISAKAGTSLKTDGKSLVKLPVHVGLVVVEEEFSLPDLAKIAVWCIILGISHISIYDRQGIVKNNQDIFNKEFQEYRKKLSSGCDIEKSNVYIQSGNKKSDSSDSLSRKGINIRLLSIEDGRQQLVELTKELSQAVLSQSLKLSDIDPLTVDTILQESVGVPDPDMVIRFGNTQSVMGFLPWQIRLTEFLSLPSHRHIEYSTFYNVLANYANTKQRFGK